MLYFVPTPIGNLEDISVRSLKLLTTTPLIFCEDTRVTKKLISLLREKHDIKSIEQKFISLHSHNEKSVIQGLTKNTFLDQDVLYVSDAGMPCISDPGILLIKFAQENNVNYTVLPGANAALLALVSSGFEGNKFYFHGFLPHKKDARKNELNEILKLTCNSIIYESTHRILQLCEELLRIAPNRSIFIIKEATKKFETIFLGTVLEVYEKIKNTNLNGEFVVVIKGIDVYLGQAITKEDILPLKIPNKQKAKLLSKLLGKSVDEWYKKLSENIDC